MKVVLYFVVVVKLSVIQAIQIKSNDQDVVHSDKIFRAYLPAPELLPPLPPVQKHHRQTSIEADPLLAALLLGASLGLHPKMPGYNHPEHLPLNPYLALLLSHYGKYSPIYGTGRGLYGYNAVNNYHNNKPFGAYKIYDDNDS